MYIKNPNQKVSYSFRIDEELLDDLKAYAQATNRKLPETLNVLLKKQLEGITVSDTYLKDEKGTIITIPFNLLDTNKPVINLYNVKNGWNYQIKQIPNNLDIWTINKGFVSPNKDYLHQGIELVLIPDLFSKEVFINLRNLEVHSLGSSERSKLNKILVPILFSMKKDETIDINIISINEALVLARNSKKVELIQLIETNFNKINKLMQDLSFNIQTSRGYERYYHKIVSELDLLSREINTKNIVKLDEVIKFDDIAFDFEDSIDVSNENLIKELQSELNDVKKDLKRKEQIIDEYENKFKKIDSLLKVYDDRFEQYGLLYKEYDDARGSKNRKK